jgi:23S rRNA pseudouridine1911/1915/1917 synthase
MANIEISQAKRLDQYVVDQIPSISRAFATKLIERKDVLVNGEPSKPGYKIRKNDQVTINYDESEQQNIPDIVLPVLFEDDDCIVINKPVGVLTHSKGAFNPEATVATFLRSKINGMSGERAGIVHRLDRATSGVIICAKNSKALSLLQKQFSTRKAKKTYMAVVEGHLNPDHAVIDMPIERNPKKPQTFRVGANGKSAVTEYEVQKSSKHYDLVKLMPQTGRTHQLRVHLAHLGHPILGDEFYGGHDADRLLLHALELEITLPNRERKVFTAPLPEAFNKTIEHDNA